MSKTFKVIKKKYLIKIKNMSFALVFPAAYKLITQNDESKEPFTSDESNSSVGGIVLLIFMLTNIAIGFYAFYLAFKCISKGGNAFVHLLGACCCTVLYIAYALATGC